jgi:chromosome segregation ATPase
MAEQRVIEANERAEAGERTAATLRHTIKDRDFKIEELGAMARQQVAKLEMLRNTFSEAKQAHKSHIDELEVRHTAQSRVLDALTAEHEWLRAETTAHDTRVAQLEQDITQQREALASERSEGRARAEELETSRRELTTARQTVNALSRQVANLADSLARSRSSLRLSHCTNLHLVARLGSPRLLLPSPPAEGDATVAPEADIPAVVAAQV